MTTQKIEINPNELRTLLIYSFRYALGRKTYASQEMVDLVLKHWDFLEEQDIDLILKDIITAIAEQNYGMEMDLAQWQRLLIKGRDRCRFDVDKVIADAAKEKGFQEYRKAGSTLKLKEYTDE